MVVEIFIGLLILTTCEHRLYEIVKYLNPLLNADEDNFTFRIDDEEEEEDPELAILRISDGRDIENAKAVCS